MMNPTTANAVPGEDRRPLKVRKIPGWNGLAHLLAARGVTPNMVSVFGLAVGLGCGIALAATSVTTPGSGWATGLWISVVVMIAIRGFCNIMDGMIAVEAGKATPEGLLYNEVPDRLADAAMLVGAGYAAGSVPTLGWLAALTAVLVAYVRAQCGLTGLAQDFCGPMGKPMRMLLIVCAALCSAFLVDDRIFAWGPSQSWGPVTIALLVIIAGGAWTFFRRLARAVRKLNTSSQ